MLLIDDIFKLLTFLDENSKITMLPRYVADNPDLIPFSRLYASDLHVLIQFTEKTEGEIRI